MILEFCLPLTHTHGPHSTSMEPTFSTPASWRLLQAALSSWQCPWKFSCSYITSCGQRERGLGGGKLRLIFPSYLEGAGAGLLLLGRRVLVVRGHGEWISKDEAGKESKGSKNQTRTTAGRRPNQQGPTCCRLLPVLVCASVSAMARRAQYIRDAEGGPKLPRGLACHSPCVLKRRGAPGAAPTQPGVKRSCGGISLVVSFVQPVIVPHLHDSAQTVPRDPHLNPGREGGGQGGGLCPAD